MSPVNEQTSSFDGFDRSELDSRRANSLDSFNRLEDVIIPGDRTPLQHFVFSQNRATITFYEPDHVTVAGRGKIAARPYGAVIVEPDIFGYPSGIAIDESPQLEIWNRDFAYVFDVLRQHNEAANQGRYEAVGRVTPVYAPAAIALKGTFHVPLGSSTAGAPFLSWVSGESRRTEPGPAYGVYDYSGDPFVFSRRWPYIVEVAGDGFLPLGASLPQGVTWIVRTIHDVGQTRRDPITADVVPAHSLTVNEYVNAIIAASVPVENWQYARLDPIGRDFRFLRGRYSSEIDDPCGDILFVGDQNGSYWSQSGTALESLGLDVEVQNLGRQTGWLRSLGQMIEELLP